MVLYDLIEEASEQGRMFVASVLKCEGYSIDIAPIMSYHYVILEYCCA